MTTTDSNSSPMFPDIQKHLKQRDAEDEKYRAFGKTMSKGCAGFQLWFKDGARKLIPFSLLGDISLDRSNPAQHLLLIPMAGQIIIIVGTQLENVLDYLQYRELKFIAELPADTTPEDNQPMIDAIVIHKLVEIQIEDEPRKLEVMIERLKNSLGPKI